ncbi:U-box domain-containing protein 34 [Phytophthora ramorum]|uniref:U-box domain-containing protein 34 n=1 Tax=Phytophthora ramorum TaxID=164328 RepID=UPI0030B0CBDA|nr:U-box domain-containing protein 34 [Phytophthora ramorum]
MAPVPFRVGSFGKIYHAVWLGSRVIVKLVDLETPAIRCAFLKEAAIWRHLHHPHIVPLYGTCISPRGETDEQGLFVCEEEENGSLRDYFFNEIQAGRTPAVWRALRDAALGLHFLHRRGIVHGDLKGNNILVNKAGVVKLTDFGLSFMPGREVSTSTPGEAIGAFQWKAPELFGTNCSLPTFESDVYALGMCIVEALRGGSPWGALPEAAVRYSLLKMKRPAAEAGLRRTISRVLPRPVNVKNDKHWAFVKQLCAFEPSERLKLRDAIRILEQFTREETMLEHSRTQSMESA